MCILKLNYIYCCQYNIYLLFIKGLSRAMSDCLFDVKRNVHTIQSYTNFHCEWCGDTYTNQWGYGNLRGADGETSSTSTSTSSESVLDWNYVNKSPSEFERGVSKMLCPAVTGWYDVKYPGLSGIKPIQPPTTPSTTATSTSTTASTSYSSLPFSSISSSLSSSIIRPRSIPQPSSISSIAGHFLTDTKEDYQNLKPSQVRNNPALMQSLRTSENLPTKTAASEPPVKSFKEKSKPVARVSNRMNVMALNRLSKNNL